MLHLGGPFVSLCWGQELYVALLLLLLLLLLLPLLLPLLLLLLLHACSCMLSWRAPFQILACISNIMAAWAANSLFTHRVRSIQVLAGEYMSTWAGVCVVSANPSAQFLTCHSLQAHHDSSPLPPPSISTAAQPLSDPTYVPLSPSRPPTA
jgi:hypothetical protein